METHPRTGIWNNCLASGRHLVLLVGFVLGLFPALAEAVVIDVLSIEREVKAYAVMGDNSDSQSFSDYGPTADWVGDASATASQTYCGGGGTGTFCLYPVTTTSEAVAYQESSWTLAQDASRLDLRLYQNNMTYAGSSALYQGDASVFNLFNMTFTLDDEADLAFGVNLNPYYPYYGNAPIRLFDQYTSTEYFNVTSDQSFSMETRLAPGSYVFQSLTSYNLYTGNGYYGIDTGYQGTAEIGFTITSVIPVPPAVWLFISGLLGLVAVARRRR